MNKIRVWHHTSKSYLNNKNIEKFLSLVKIEKNGLWTYSSEYKVERSAEVYDANLKEIFEGDVITSPEGLVEVIYVSAGFRFGKLQEPLMDLFIGWEKEKEVYDTTVIGSLMENPDLIDLKHAENR